MESTTLILLLFAFLLFSGIFGKSSACLEFILSYRLHRIRSIRDALRGKTEKEEDQVSDQEGQGQGWKHIRMKY